MTATKWQLPTFRQSGCGCATRGSRVVSDVRLSTRSVAALPQMLSVLYRLYERRLLREVQASSIPRHIGIILDGNRRYGREQGLHDPRQVYDLGARKLDEVLDWCADLDVPAVTLWVFSTANLDRDADEVSGILGAVEAKMRSLADDPQI